MLRWYQVFLVGFFFALAAQVWIWSWDSFTDESAWVERLQHMERDVRDGTFDQKDYSGHPGTAVLLPAAGIRALGFSDTASLKASVAILVSLAIGAMAALIHQLSPDSAWWLSATGMAALHPLFTKASPMNAVAAAGLALAFFPIPWWLLGLAIGVSLATHFSLALLIGIPVLFWRKSLGALLVAVVIFIALDPLFLQHPISHTAFMLQRIELHVETLGATRLRAWDLPLFAPLALISWLLALIDWKQQWRAALIITVAVSAALLYAHTQSIRYFFPLIMFWEAVLPQWFLQRRLPAMAGLLVAGQLLFLIQALY